MQNYSRNTVTTNAVKVDLENEKKVIEDYFHKTIQSKP